MTFDDALDIAVSRVSRAHEPNRVQMVASKYRSDLEAETAPRSSTVIDLRDEAEGFTFLTVKQGEAILFGPERGALALLFAGLTVTLAPSIIDPPTIKVTRRVYSRAVGMFEDQLTLVLPGSFEAGDDTLRAIKANEAQLRAWAKGGATLAIPLPSSAFTAKQTWKLAQRMLPSAAPCFAAGASDEVCAEVIQSQGYSGVVLVAGGPPNSALERCLLSAGASGIRYYNPDQEA